jgi:drug/metabolite transporter (DMT)-like permease
VIPGRVKGGVEVEDALADILSRMTGLALSLVLVSAALHATWNLLMKRATRPEVFSWWMLVSAGVLLLPMGVVLLWLYPPPLAGWGFLAGTSFLHVFYFMWLGRSYARADLSLAYPIARGTGPALVPIAAALILRESVAPLAIGGIACVVLGIYTVGWGGQFGRLLGDPLAVFKSAGTRYALLTGLIITAYTLWDKQGVRHVNPFLYVYIQSVGAALGLAPYILSKRGRAAVGEEWRRNRLPVAAAGLLMFAAYGMVLTALTFTRVSYVAPAREVGIVFGALMGIVLLKEGFARSRLLGALLVVAGLVLIALSP